MHHFHTCIKIWHFFSVINQTPALIYTSHISQRDISNINLKQMRGFTQYPLWSSIMAANQKTKCRKFFPLTMTLFAAPRSSCFCVSWE
jgi:hypothetical protein